MNSNNADTYTEFSIFKAIFYEFTNKENVFIKNKRYYFLYYTLYFLEVEKPKIKKRLFSVTNKMMSMLQIIYAWRIIPCKIVRSWVKGVSRNTLLSVLGNIIRVGPNEHLKMYTLKTTKVMFKKI